jgi:FkbM family methyltransferase
MKYSIVIPTYNHCDDLLKPCIQSLQKYTDLSDIEIIVVANGCTDNTREYVESLGPGVKLIWYDNALGYTLATNAGIKAASGEYVMLLNNDVEILPCEPNSWLNTLTKPFLDDPLMALTGTLKLHDPDINREFIVFCCALIKHDVFYRIGLPDEIFSPGYGEDIDFSQRVLAHGLKWQCVDETRPGNGMHIGSFPIWHKGNKTFSEIPSYATHTVQKNRQILIDRYNKPPKTNNMKYSVIIPTYNHCNDLLKPCIDTILKFTDMGQVELIISANGCTDNTREYLADLQQKFNDLGFCKNLKVIWHDQPLGYSRACNVGIREATADLIVLLNNDTLLLGQEPSTWLKMLTNPFASNPKCGISCIIKGPSEPAGHNFAIFFCVMIHRRVFDRIGLLNEEYGVGGGEDTEFSIECERAGFEVCLALDTKWSTQSGMYTGNFPIYHKGEGTVHDATLVPEWSRIFLENSLKLAKKYNPKWYQWRLSNYWERAVFFKGDPVASREVTRYTWAAQNLTGKKIFELGCSSGYGIQFMPRDIEYTGLDYDKYVIDAAWEQKWDYNAKFVHADINTYQLDHYDTIIAFEVIEHLDNGLEIVKKLQQHCDRLLITVPMLEPPGKWGPHHKLHMLDEKYFPGFEFKYIAPNGDLLDQPLLRGDPDNINLMLCVWNRNPEQKTNIDMSSNYFYRKQNYKTELAFLKQQDSEIYEEVIGTNTYEINPDTVLNMEVIDVGANIGCFSAFMGYLGAKKVVAVEPVRSTFGKLTNNVQHLKLQNVELLNNAVGSADGGTIRISNQQNRPGENSAYNTSGTFDEISTVSLSTIVSKFSGNNIFLKCDCEGGEYDLLMHAQVSDMARITHIAIEIHEELHPTYKGSKILHDRFMHWGFTRTREKRLYSWNYNAQGETVNYKPIPVVVELWKR